MKHKRAEAEPTEQQRPDRHHENPSRTSAAMRQPRASESPIAIANEPARNWANLRGAGAEVSVMPLERAKVQLWSASKGLRRGANAFHQSTAARAKKRSGA